MLEGIILGFDFGMRRLGVAVGQTITKTATPLLILPTRDGIPNWEQLNILIDKWCPAALVVGVPINMDDSEMLITFAARKFANRLRERYRLPVYPVDERLSSRAAHQQLERVRKPSPIYYKKIDHIAAQIILEQWLYEHTSLATLVSDSRHKK